MEEFDFDLEDNGSDDVLAIPCQLEIYLKGRDEPIQVFCSFRVAREAVSAEDPVQALMDHMEFSLLSVLDTKGEERMVFKDARSTRAIVLVEEIQAISALAPDVETVQAMLDASDE